MIYFAQPCGLPFVKIGSAGDVRRRLSALQSGNHVELKLIAVMDGGGAEERALHLRFKHLRGVGEWFRMEGELAEYVSALPAREPPNPATAALSLRMSPGLLARARRVAKQRRMTLTELVTIGVPLALAEYEASR